MPKDTSILTIPNDTAYLPVVAAYVTAAAGQLGFDEVETGDIRLAVDEACAHVLETAFDPGEQQDVTISCQRFPSGLRVTVADKGLPFDPRAIQAYDARGGLDRDLSGLPFYLIQQAMDEVRFVNRGWGGKELQLTKYLKVPGVETYFAQEELLPFEAQVEPAPPGEYRYRLMEPEDAVEVARCVYRTWGYSYPGEHVYFPERVASMNQSGEMISAVATTEGGEVVGHCALSGQAGDRVMEASQAVVVPAHRGRGILKGLMDLLMEKARQRDLTGLFINAVTIHPYSQRVGLKYGFREAAVLLGYGPRHIQMKQIADEALPQRESIVYGYQPLATATSSMVFAPAQHQPMIARIYDNLGLAREFAEEAEARKRVEARRRVKAFGEASETQRFALSTKVVSALEVATIQVVTYGPGIEEEVRTKLWEVCHEGTAVVYLYLPLGDPNTALLCEPFESLGFFFSGVQIEPAGKGETDCGDVLCLQYLNGPRIDYARLQIYSPFGQELIAYIRERDPQA